MYVGEVLQVTLFEMQKKKVKAIFFFNTIRDLHESCWQ